MTMSYITSGSAITVFSVGGRDRSGGRVHGVCTDPLLLEKILHISDANYNLSGWTPSFLEPFGPPLEKFLHF